METCDDNPGLPPNSTLDLYEGAAAPRQGRAVVPARDTSHCSRKDCLRSQGGGGPGSLRETWHLAEQPHLTAVLGWRLTGSGQSGGTSPGVAAVYFQIVVEEASRDFIL